MRSWFRAGVLFLKTLSPKPGELSHPFMQYIHRYEWLAYGFLAIVALAVSLPLFPYRWHIFLHIGGAAVFLGNIIVTGAWMLMAKRTRNVNVIHFPTKAVIRADLLFTLPGVLLVLINGLVMVFDR